MAARGAGASSSRRIGDLFSEVRWYHWAGGAAGVGAFNAGLLVALGGGYRWFYANDYEEVRQFRTRYGLPTEQQRLNMFRWMAADWDKNIANFEHTCADVYRRELLASGDARGDVLEVAIGTGRCYEALREGAAAATALAAATAAERATAVEGASAELADDKSTVNVVQSSMRSFVGVDILDEMLEVAGKKLPDALPCPARVERADAHKLPFPDKSFDSVLGSLCLCSVERPAEVLCEMARVCRPGGTVFLVEPGVANSLLIRAAQRFMGLVPNEKHSWEVGWYDDIDPKRLVDECPSLRTTQMRTGGMGNWYLIKATPC